MVETVVIGGPASTDLAKRLARRLKARFVGVGLDVFADGESKLTLKGRLKRARIIVVQSMEPPVDQNLVRLVSLIIKAKESSADVVAVVPYVGYARQDREFLSGEIVTIKTVASMIRAAGAKRLVVVDMHSKVGLAHFKIKAENVSAVRDLAGYCKGLGLKEPVVISPDSGGAARAKEFGRHLDCNVIVLSKTRNRKTGKVTITTEKVDGIQNNDLILVDDMISTGGSIVKAIEFLKGYKYRRIYVACTHALLTGNARIKIKKAGAFKIISTNTISGATAQVDVSGTVAQALD